MKTQEQRSVDFRRVFLVAVALFFVDAYLMGQGMLAAITILVSGFILLPMAVYRKIRYAEDSQYIKKYLVYIVTGFLVFIALIANNKLATYRAELLVQNLELYKKENGTYPKNLQQLVPKYYSSVPTAKISVSGKFYYFAAEGNEPSLFYVIYPPFYRNGYDFKSKVWRPFD